MLKFNQFNSINEKIGSNKESNILADIIYDVVNEIWDRHGTNGKMRFLFDIEDEKNFVKSIFIDDEPFDINLDINDFITDNNIDLGGFIFRVNINPLKEPSGGKLLSIRKSKFGGKRVTLIANGSVGEELKRILNHELLHFIQLLNKSKSDRYEDNRNYSYSQFNKMINHIKFDNKAHKLFNYKIYLSTKDEMGARISDALQELKSYSKSNNIDLSDPKEMTKALKTTSTWLAITYLEMDLEEYIIKNINTKGTDEQKVEFFVRDWSKRIGNKEYQSLDTNVFMAKWMKMFDKNVKEYKKRLYKLYDHFSK